MNSSLPRREALAIVLAPSDDLSLEQVEVSGTIVTDGRRGRGRLSTSVGS